MSLPPYVNVGPSICGTSTKSTLLTPPVTPLSTDDVPFRVTDDDNMSLNMRKGKHTRAKDKKKSRESRSRRVDPEHSNEVKKLVTGENTEMLRSKSMGRVRASSSKLGSPQAAQTGPSSREDNDERRVRRWTLPSKSVATRGLTALRSTVRQATLSEEVESPAMITLRRATTNKSPQRNELTFFPEPTFGNERSGLLSYLVSTFTRANSADMAAALFSSTKSSRTNSVGSDSAHAAMTYPAATVCTETTVEPSLIHPGTFDLKLKPRRCSAKYVAGDTSYEVIWDENDSLSSTQASSPPSVADRRASVAVMKLEAQLARSEPSTRRPSGGSSKSASSALQIYAQALTPDKLNQVIPRLLHSAGLQNLPKSRTGRQRRDTVCSIIVDEPERQTLFEDKSRKASTFSIDFFPPLSSTTSRRASVLPSPGDFSELLNGGRRRTSSTSNGPPTKHSSRLGSMVGASSHARRRSSAFVDNTARRESTLKKPGRKSSGRVSKVQEREFDTTPLLDSKAKGRALYD